MADTAVPWRRVGVISWGGQYRRYLQLALDAAAWILALFFATAARWDFSLPALQPRQVAVFAVIAASVQGLAGLGSGLYLGRWRFGSFEEVLALVRTAAITTLVVALLDLRLTPRPVPLSATLAGGITALVLMSGARYAWRLRLEKARRPAGDTLERMLVFGAGEGGGQVITAMMRAPDSPYLPVALLDDDPAKRNLRIIGVRVAGTRNRIRQAAEVHRAKVMLIAIPSADSTTISELTQLAEDAELDVKVLPPVRELFGTRVQVGDIRDLSPADLLGRHEIHTDVASIAGYLTGKRVLVTGAGGSIGSELCRQIYRFAPAELIMLDRDESALHGVQLSIHGRALLDSPDLVLANICDRDRIAQVFADYRPEVVFHAAALKHLPLLEQHPAEAMKVNVWGTLHVLEAAANGVERFVNISTDKAADPISVLGYSKRITERLTAWFGQEESGTFLSVRFGNVLGSRGSVLKAFQAQVEVGGPITVTHPDVTRYFMTIEEACELVIQAAAIGSSGQALVLDMGEPVRIADVARIVASRSRRPIDICFTGLRKGEKLAEHLFAAGETGERPIHPLISHVSVPPLNPTSCPFSDCLAHANPTPWERLAYLG